MGLFSPPGHKKTGRRKAVRQHMGASNGKTLPFSAEVLTRLRLRRVRAELPCFVLPIYYTMGNAACQSQIAKKIARKQM